MKKKKDNKCIYFISWVSNDVKPRKTIKMLAFEYFKI